MTTSIDIDLKDYLSQISQKIDKLSEDVNELKTGQTRIEEKVTSLDERTKKLEDSQEKQIWALIVLLGGSLISIVVRYLIFFNP